MKYRKIKITCEFKGIENILNGLVERLGEDNLLRVFNDRNNFFRLEVKKCGIKHLGVLPREDWEVDNSEDESGIKFNRLVHKGGHAFILDDWGWIDPLEGEDALRKMCLIEMFVNSFECNEFKARLIF